MTTVPKRTCGNCFLAERGSDTTVFCFGTPPTVISAAPVDNGGVAVGVQAPLVPKERRACGMHGYRWSLRALWWRRSGGA